MSRALTCAVVVSDRVRVLLGHATRSPRWDVPKGLAEPGETPEQAARRELQEETGLVAPPVLLFLGVHAYLPRKDAALFAWLRPDMPDPASLNCTATVGTGPAAFPEFDRFAIPSWEDALPMLGKSMAALLARIAREQGWYVP